MNIPTSTRSTPSSNSLRWSRSPAPLRPNRSAEDALKLAGDLDAPPAEWPAVLNTRAIYLDNAGRRREAAMYFREAARLADEHGVARSAAMAMVNLTNLLNMDDPAAAVVVSRDAIDTAVRCVDVHALGVGVTNLVLALDRDR